MDFFATPKREDLEITGVSRSGRVRKRSSKLMDFDSSNTLPEVKPKKPKIQSPQELKKKKPITNESQSSSPVPHVTHTIHVAQIHHPPANKVAPITISPPKKSPKLPTITIQKKKKIESSSDYETQSQSTNSESDDEVNKKLHIAEFTNKKISMTSIDPSVDEIISTKKKTPSPKKPKKNIVSPEKKQIIKPKIKSETSPPKPKTRYTAYMLWSKEMRQDLLKDNPNMDFTAISKRLGELWAKVPNQEKYNWSNRAKRLAEKNQASPPKKFMTKTTPVKSPINDSPKKKTETSRSSDSKKINPAQLTRTGEDAIRDPTKEMRMFRAIELEPIDVAAYLKLLGESLTVIGERLKEHNGQITVSGSLSVLLDSLLCALGSLTCLTQQVPAIGNENATSLSKTLENIAYIMPGL